MTSITSDPDLFDFTVDGQNISFERMPDGYLSVYIDSNTSDYAERYGTDTEVRLDTSDAADLLVALQAWIEQL